MPSTSRRFGVATRFAWPGGTEQQFIRWFNNREARDKFYEAKLKKMATYPTILSITKVERLGSYDDS